MVPTNFVDRVEPMAQLSSLAGGLAGGHGRAFVVEGRSGMGKTALLAKFAQNLAAGEAQPSSCVVVSTRCHPEIGAGLTYAPALDLLVQLHEQTEQPGWLRRVLKAAGLGVVKSAPAMLSALVPGLGAVWTAGREAAETALKSGSAPLDSVMPIQLGAALQISEALLAGATPERPVVLLVDDVQFIDPSSLLVLDRVVRKLATKPVALVLSHTRPDTDTAVSATLDLWERDGLATRCPLDGLPEDAVQELVALKFDQHPATLPGEVFRLTGGHSLLVSLCLEEWQRDSDHTGPLPASVARVVEARLRALDEQDRRIVAVAAVQGPVFLSRLVAETVALPHEEVIERLSRIARHRLITLHQPPAWAEAERTDCYAFEHAALWRVVYEQQTPEQRRSRHERIAQALLAVDTEPADLPLGRRLEIAHHLDRGGAPCLEDSADAHYALARSAALDGLSFTEAESHCEVAIKAARALPRTTPGRDRRLVSAIELLLSLTEVRWQGQAMPARGLDVDALAAEAEQAALRCGDARLVARTTLLRGKSLLVTRGLGPSLVKLREAIEKAARAEDPVALFVAKVEYGRQVSKHRLADGLAQLYEVERMYASDPALGATGDPVLQHARNLAEMQLAVNLFDSGRLGEALGRLLRCVDRLRQEPLGAELPIALNYLAQVHTAVGRPDQAEQALLEALAFEDRRGGDSGWHAYNTALYARLLAADPDPTRRAEASAAIERAWLETERTWLANLVPIVRNLYADILLDLAVRPDEQAGARAEESYREQLRRADKLALDTHVETEQTGMVRSRIAALTLRGRAHLALGEPAAAARYAGEAVRILDEVGDMPALRTEEVLYHAALAQDGAGDPAAAKELLGRARAVVLDKAAHIEDPELRGRFLADVALNRRILADGGSE
ncbi:hypothetical protein CFP65_1395 [Kitasatospora sp. MMS16-BH015]|uniref:AAA family ATPase n=1 Tax=Kitasatospora sp. MMS16-BH015 TaxID=2018025 RepID=UPI000CA3612D|nr:AAA family ATPase [Kitasatospora sp. MMS16-BH015]AUG76294.1 hypothetical protein CFP65_1395 [Kitasatospora sp. MMS16-BH015]